MKKNTTYLLASVALCAFAGCQQTDTASNKPKKTGTYAAARHSTVGSNIPQRESVDATGATYDPNQFRNFQDNSSNLGRGGTLSGSGR